MIRCVDLLLAGSLMLASGCYVTSQVLHQNDLFNTRQPLGDVLADPTTDAKTRTALLAVRHILSYAEASGLKTKGAYRYVIRSHKPVVSYIVEAAQPDRLAFVTQWFPFVGDVPYLGYFEESERDAKAKEFAAAGYDVYTSGAGAFSSLGWFEDPIFSSMLDRSEPEMAHLFFHELTHRTLWVPGSFEFNENLAEYVAGKLTPAYLEASGQASQIARYEAKHRDRAVFKRWLLALKQALEGVYAKPLPRAKILELKADVLASYQRPPLKPKFEVADYIAGEVWNNASILGASLYAPDIERFDRAAKCLGDPGVDQFLKALRRASSKESDAFRALDSLCAPASSPAVGAPHVD